MELGYCADLMFGAKGRDLEELIPEFAEGA